MNDPDSERGTGRTTGHLEWAFFTSACTFKHALYIVPHMAMLHYARGLCVEVLDAEPQLRPEIFLKRYAIGTGYVRLAVPSVRILEGHQGPIFEDHSLWEAEHGHRDFIRRLYERLHSTVIR